ncbi:hypothetical protein MKL09_17830 [Methylobacterium sp. J-048]|uniref:hypothetical protein n=1 Tax=Methylobacterium sp. J-048 TaxID=2836635 RepID=UPI001FBBC3A8|nr:hypothetical protein [Methylobacterium sp. J-048]MCJ2058404.1 hypothetical protein [Methylobacterium sp. J-048]
MKRSPFSPAMAGQRIPGLGILLVSLPILVIAHHAAVLPHEYGHSVAAWLLGLKATPGSLRWGPPTLVNALTLHGIGENVDYARSFAAGRGAAVALVAATGPLFVNGGAYLSARAVLPQALPRLPWLGGLFLYWFLFMNLANVFDYVPIRTFAQGDIGHFCQGLDIPSWVVCAVLTPLVLAALLDLYRTVLPSLYRMLDLPLFARFATHILTTSLMFGYFGLAGLHTSDTNSAHLSLLSLACLPVVLVIGWPRRTWSRAKTDAATSSLRAV